MAGNTKVQNCPARPIHHRGGHFHSHMKLKTDGDRAIETLNRIHKICLDHLGNSNVGANVTVGRIIAWLDPWPLREQPRKDNG